VQGLAHWSAEYHGTFPGAEGLGLRLAKALHAMIEAKNWLRILRNTLATRETEIAVATLLSKEWERKGQVD